MDLVTVRSEAIKMIKEHNLYEKGWRFRWSGAKRQFGYCDLGNKRIALSRHLVAINEWVNVKNTILHEIAHALTPGTHHGPAWVRMAQTIGCDGQRCYSSAVVKVIPRTIKGTCPGCGKTVMKFKRRRTACRQCCDKYNGGKFDSKFMFTWEKI